MIIRLVDYRHIGTISIVIVGIAALSVCRWYVAEQYSTYSRYHIAVRCQCRVGSVGRLAQSLVIGLVRRHISARSYQVHRHISIRLVNLYLQAYWHGVLLV